MEILDRYNIKGLAKLFTLAAAIGILVRFLPFDHGIFKSISHGVSYYLVAYFVVLFVGSGIQTFRWMLWSKLTEQQAFWLDCLAICFASLLGFLMLPVMIDFLGNVGFYLWDVEFYLCFVGIASFLFAITAKKYLWVNHRLYTLGFAIALGFECYALMWNSNISTGLVHGHIMHPLQGWFRWNSPLWLLTVHVVFSMNHERIKAFISAKK